MRDRNDVFKRFHDTLNNTEGRFHILEQRVPVEAQMEYFKYSEQMRKDGAKMTDDKLQVYRQNLSNTDMSAEHRKYVLSALAVSGDIRAYRLLEGYVENPDPEVADWAYMALMESRLSIESELLEERQIYISTGLGGRGEKLRFFVLLTASGREPFKDYQRHVIEHEAHYYLSAGDCEIERLTICGLHVELVVLSPIRLDIKNIFERFLYECNQYGNFISNVLTITNMRELSAAEIEEIIRRNHEDGNI
ncbi:MAG: hypothetical protein LBI58_04520 [Tannerellaceae bacterium]|jgi:hypothetical protein|nr:hypothetical protein [Tannerellaceae bacterium]